MMSTTTRPTRKHHGTADTPSAGPVARVALASLATGALGALVGILLIVPGAAEHTTTGVALLAFAAGWAMLAILSARFTSQPQRWARVPAAAMTATGLGLLILAPGNDGITNAGWVWPPVLLALIIWCAVQLRDAMSSRRGRWLLYPLLAGIALASVGGFSETVALSHDHVALIMPGARYDIGGRQLHLNCTGTGSPTVILSNGTGEMSQNWARIIPQVAAMTRVCAYDRAGQGWSDNAPHPQDGIDVANDLRALLGAAGEHGPYVLAGHSLGGVYAMTYAAKYPNDIAGMVLLDSSTPEQFTALPDYPGVYQMMRRLYGTAPSVARFGVGRLYTTSAYSTLPEPAAGQVRAFGTSSRGLENAREDVSRFHDAFRQAQALTTLGGKPLVVLTARGSLKDTPGWSAAQDKLATLSTNVTHTTADTSHEGVVGDEDGAAASAKAINAAVRASRTGQHSN
jgi:pimeloyl-ACP methyl ester carboxylesterase